MSAFSTKTKTKVGVKAARQAAKHPKLVLRGAQGAKPLVRGTVNGRTRQARNQARVAVGIGVGAAAMYLLDPASGDQRRRRVLGLITPNGGSGHQHNAVDADNEPGGPAHPAPGHLPPAR
jgi:hypothetical protein